mmetsp:Transcript_30886/g.49539  ORF Transcript_30886/g.49539 Transcript_30886/m.49539 type:complete len:586 (-) Transcript_30886:1291-3048(-)
MRLGNGIAYVFGICVVVIGLTTVQFYFQQAEQTVTVRKIFENVEEEANTTVILKEIVLPQEKPVKREKWNWVPERIEKLMAREDNKTANLETPLIEISSARPSRPIRVNISEQYSRLVNWNRFNAEGSARPGLVIGTQQIVSRDIQTIAQAYRDWGLRIFSKTYGDIHTGQRDWSLIICLALNTRLCVTEENFVELENNMRETTRINRMAGLLDVLWSKENYCSTIQQSGEWMNAFTFPCWVVPRDGSKLQGVVKKLSGHDGIQWIVKPYNKGGGRGIFVLDSLTEVRRLLLKKRHYVVQPYLPNPYLLDGRKWDLRTYVLLTRSTPVTRAYIYFDGLVRLATEQYDPNAKNGGNKTQFLTNTSINKQKVQNVEELTWAFAKLEATIGEENYQKLFRRMKRAVAMLLVTAENRFKQVYEKKFGDKFTCGNCFHLLGVDLIVDENLVPRIIEVNGEPSMQLSGDKDGHYDMTKKAMQHEVARIVLTPMSKVRRLTAQTLRQLRISNETAAWIESNPDVLLYLLQAKREFHQLRNFQALYPDPYVCDNAGRKKLWLKFIAGLHDGRDTKEWRLKAHELFHKFVCQLV